MNEWRLDKREAKSLSRLNNAGLDCCLIYLTPTGVEKGILDATAPLRQLLKEENIHDFSTQEQGPKFKRILPCTLFANGKSIKTRLSLYRPMTKTGDPRMWPYGLNKYASGNQVLALFVYDRDLFLVNLSEPKQTYLGFDEAENSANGALHAITELDDFLTQLTINYNATANELLRKLEKISAGGAIQAVGSGDTAIGRTLESHLGIAINCSPLPDYKGIEIKSSRASSNTRSSLFAKVADWNISHFKSSKQIVEAFGYPGSDDKSKRLYCTVSTRGVNPQGLIFDLDLDLARLEELVRSANADKPVCAWKLSTLHNKLFEKHKETFWVSADRFEHDGVEYFTLKTVKHTRRPSGQQFDRLLGSGEITMDHLIKLDTRTGRCREKGPLFKIQEESIDELFLGQPQVYML